MLHDQLRRQIRAGRELLGLNQADIAEIMSVSLSKISRAENGDTKSIDTLLEMKAVLDRLGIELSEEGGVRPRQSRLYRFVGREGFREFFDDVFQVAKNSKDPNICVTNVNEKDFIRWRGDHAETHRKRMEKLEGSSVRALICAGDQNRSGASYVTYRWIEPTQFAAVSLYLYGLKTAFIEFSEDNVIVTVTDSPAITDSMRKMFETTWAQASRKPL